MDESNSLFRSLNAEEIPETTDIESLCVNCHKNGVTKMMLTKIPFYKDVILFWFSCQHCGFENKEVKSDNVIQEKGIRITLNAREPADLSRILVKTQYTAIQIPEIEFEIPALSQESEITTVESVISKAAVGLREYAAAIIQEDQEKASKIYDVVRKLEEFQNNVAQFTMIIEDISGNTFLSNPNAPHQDPRAITSVFVRNTQQNQTLGIYENEEGNAPTNADGKAPDNADQPRVKRQKLDDGPSEGIPLPEDMSSEVFQMMTNCSHCNAPCPFNTKLTKIPHFKEVLIMASNCDNCGYRTNEVKSGSGIEPKGKRIVVKINYVGDLNRDVLKSETCKVMIPELDLLAGPATLGGRFTTVEGLLTSMKDQICRDTAFYGRVGDHKLSDKLIAFLTNIDKCVNGDMRFTLILEDPAGNSYVSSRSPPQPDPQVTVTEYERTKEENDDLGISDMNVDNY